ncbi:hypothetical protein BDF20DRAFT_121400 [Mycotypha africana]|uniref:uncharacterized protein n=1 Tax=Mycotypha africana TaxID=64632 RepID=UPI0023007028|nr:uncharacterized protein BDF20DRAFT_121400 [Mycotypha africana]KAI8970369.1 hypothetical protein BDF20DRAFT_121400 [Mycotypha africana]
MNYSRIAPNIKPYTAQQNMASEASQSYPSNLYPQQQQSVTYQASHSSDHQPIYRPAYRRIPYTSFSTSQLPKSSFASMLPEPAPIIVPSQQHFLPFPNLKVSSDQTECTLTDKQSATSGSINSADQIPQLHGDCTFENDLSISSVSYEQTHQKELVKDVFFSPAYMIISDNVRRASSQCDWSSSASLSAQSDDGSEVMTSSIYSDNTQETPSDVLYGEGSNHSIDILGLELISESLLILDQNDDTGKDIACLNSNDKMNRKLAYKQTAFETINYLHGAHDLPTQSNLSSTRGTNKFTQNKRRRSDSAVQQQYINKRSRTKANSVDFTTLTERPHVFSATTSSPFVTPSSSLEHEFNLDSSEYYPTVDSNEAKPSKSAGNSLTVEQSRFGNEISDTAINFQHNQDAFSIKLDEEEHISTADVQEDDLDVNQPYTLTNQNSFSNTQKLEESAKVPPRPTLYPTIYQKLTEANIDWCRYCGTTEGVNWRPGPWGKRTLCK